MMTELARQWPVLPVALGVHRTFLVVWSGLFIWFALFAIGIDRVCRRGVDVISTLLLASSIGAAVAGVVIAAWW